MQYTITYIGLEYGTPSVTKPLTNIFFIWVKNIFIFGLIDVMFTVSGLKIKQHLPLQFHNFPLNHTLYSCLFTLLTFSLN